jgi:hypothetical protein
MRSKQLNRGAREAAHQCLIFVHGDTRLPAGAAEAVANALEISAFGAFRIAFAEADAKLRLAATMINLRSSITGCPWGDQAQFIRRDTFLDSGGFREIPLMEDYELALRMRRRGRTTVLALKVTTSGRRFLRRGVLRTAFTNWQIIVRYRLGADPQELAKIYLR